MQTRSRAAKSYVRTRVRVALRILSAAFGATASVVMDTAAVARLVHTDATRGMYIVHFRDILSNFL